jgi:hypothetical protein
MLLHHERRSRRCTHVCFWALLLLLLLLRLFSSSGTTA